MKKTILNNQHIRPTANGQSIVEGSYARVVVIEGNSEQEGIFVKNSSISGIESHNRNLFGENSEEFVYKTNEQILPATKQYSNTSYLVEQYNKRTKNNPHNALTYSFTLEVKKVDGYTNSNNDIVIGKIIVTYTDGSQVAQFNKKVKITDSEIWSKKRYSTTIELDYSKNISSVSIYAISESKNIDYITYNNQLEYSSSPTNFVVSSSNNFDLGTEIILRSTLSQTWRDRYYPEQGIIVRAVSTDSLTSITPYIESVTPRKFLYKVHNNGCEKLLGTSSVLPNVITEYLIENNQGGDFSRFDYFMIDGEGFCGIGYEKLKTTNQLTYAEEPSRQQDGSMHNIEDYNTFVLGALEVGFNCLNEETYRRLKEKLISKRTFDITYYDKDFDKYITKEMYVKPIDLDNFLSFGDDIIGMNFTIGFVPTLNEETYYTVKFLNSDMSEYQTISNNSVTYGSSIDTPKLPSGYSHWLMINSPFGENTYMKVKEGKKLSIFGDTTLIASK